MGHENGQTQKQKCPFISCYIILLQKLPPTTPNPPHPHVASSVFNTFWCRNLVGMHATISVTFTPTEHSDWTLYVTVSVMFCLYKCVQRYECIPGETAWKCAPLYPYLNDYHVSPLSMTTAFSHHLWLWWFTTAIKSFPFRHGWMTCCTTYCFFLAKPGPYEWL